MSILDRPALSSGHHPQLIRSDVAVNTQMELLFATTEDKINLKGTQFSIGKVFELSLSA
jgi:hypothetical protein